ncbi:MAG TPA: hypothetical protein DIT05_07375 [Morganella sp. (in: Bacteria)]|nr:hypothetical protein [Morganella sp. (in: enterobacteria)]
MTISNKRLDNLDESVSVNNLLSHYEIKHRIDNICIVSEIGAKNIDELFTRLNELEDNNHYVIKCGKAKGKDIKKLYRRQIEIRNKCNSKQVLVIHYMPTEIDFKKTDKYQGRGSVRLDISPQHFSVDDINELILCLGKAKRLGKYMYQLLKNAWVTRIDYALDIYNMRLSDYHIGFKGVRCGKRNSSDGEFQGQRLGSNKSDYHFSCYEKLDVGNDLASLNALDDDELQLKVANWRDIQHYRQFLRLEIRYEPRKKALLLRNLRSLHNLLARLLFYKKPLIVKGLDFDCEELLSHMTLPELREYVKEVYPNEAKNHLKRLDNRLKSNQIDLFNKDKLWCDFHLLVDKLGILGVPALWQKNLREKWARKHGYK